jgi:hypothetical protein
MAYAVPALSISKQQPGHKYYFNIFIMHVDSRSSYRSRLDVIGIGASLVCAIHCVVLPFFISSLPFLGIELLKNTVVETMIIGLSLVVGCLALLTGYRRRHGRLWPVLLFAGGMMVLMSDTIWVTSTTLDMVGKALAAACIITAHAFNWKYTNESGQGCHHEPEVKI